MLSLVFTPDPSHLSLNKKCQRKIRYFVISIVLPGVLLQGLRVTFMFICSLAKGFDSDNVRHSGPDIHASHKQRSLSF